MKQCLVILHSGKAQMSEMLWDQAFEGRRSPKTILSTDNKRLSWRICLWGLLKTRHIHLLLLSKCWHPVEAHGLWTPWPHRMLGPQEFLSLKSINYSMRILLKAWEDMDGMGILKMSSVRVRPAGSWTTHLLTSWLLGKASGHKACRILIPRPGIKSDLPPPLLHHIGNTVLNHWIGCQGSPQITFET